MASDGDGFCLKKIITDEHSGRIMIDQELASQEKEKMQKVFSKMK